MSEIANRLCVDSKKKKISMTGADPVSVLDLYLACAEQFSRPECMQLSWPMEMTRTRFKLINGWRISEDTCAIIKDAGWDQECVSGKYSEIKPSQNSFWETMQEKLD